MAPIQACIFDLDGVIVDTAKYHYQAWRRLAHELGFEFTEEQNERLKGVSRMRSLDILLEIGHKQGSPQEKETLASKKNRWYVELISTMTPSEILPGSIAFLQSLRAAGMKIGLGSASKNAMAILKNIALDHFFDAIVDGNIVSKAKPDPEIFLKAASLLKVEPIHCVVFEDALAGIEAAKNGGMHCIGVGSPLTLKIADHVIPSLNDITLEQLRALFAR